MAELKALGDKIFDSYNIYPGDGERNHCLRLVELARLHAGKAGTELDEGLLHLAAMLHDLGLMVKLRPGSNYLTRTWELARQEIDRGELDEPSWKLLEESLLYNHAMRPPRPLLGPAEAFRRAVFTEHSRGIQRFGLPRREVTAVFDAVPWANFDAVLADFIWKTVVFEPMAIPRIFFPR